MLFKSGTRSATNFLELLRRGAAMGQRFEPSQTHICSNACTLRAVGLCGLINSTERAIGFLCLIGDV